jgi:transposase
MEGQGVDGDGAQEIETAVREELARSAAWIDIKRRYGLNNWQISRVAQQLCADMLVEGHSTKAVAETLNIAASTVRRWAHNDPEAETKLRAWRSTSIHERAQIVEAARNGSATQVLAERHGISVATVQRIKRAAGLT